MFSGGLWTEPDQPADADQRQSDAEPDESERDGQSLFAVGALEATERQPSAERQRQPDRKEQSGHLDRKRFTIFPMPPNIHSDTAPTNAHTNAPAIRDPPKVTNGSKNSFMRPL